MMSMWVQNDEYIFDWLSHDYLTAKLNAYDYDS